jgi:hypothetical protein
VVGLSRDGHQHAQLPTRPSQGLCRPGYRSWYPNQTVRHPPVEETVMADIGDRVTATTKKGGPRSGVVTAVSGILITVRWDAGGQTSLIAGPGVLSVVTSRRRTRSARSRLPTSGASPTAGKKIAARKKAAATKIAPGKKIAAKKKPVPKKIVTKKKASAGKKAAPAKKVVAKKITARKTGAAKKTTASRKVATSKPLAKKRGAKAGSSSRTTGKKRR